jgi:hypothetical protein
MAATAGPRLPGRLLGELVGVDPGVDGVQHGQPRVVDRPGGELDRVGSVSFGPICLAASNLGIVLVGPPLHLRVEVLQLGGGVGLQLGPLAAGAGRGRARVLAGVLGGQVDIDLGLVEALAQLLPAA